MLAQLAGDGISRTNWHQPEANKAGVGFMGLDQTATKRSVKRALVLEGGGAKGAFAFGCLKALHDRNIGFDAVSGTSVGALNAVIYSTGKIKEGEALWCFLTYRDLFKVRWPRILAPVGRLISPVSGWLSKVLPRKIRHPPLIDLVLALGSFWLWTAFSNMSRWFLVGHEPLHWLLTPLMTIVLSAPPLLIIHLTCPWGGFWCLPMQALAIAANLIYVYDRRSDRRQLVAFASIGLLIFGSLSFLAANVAARFGEPYDWPPFVGYYILVGWGVLFGLLFAAEQSIFDVKRLYKRVCKLTRGATLRPATYVTTATEEKTLAEKVLLPQHYGQTRPTEVDSFEYAFRAVYHRIDHEHGSRLTRRVMASASLPGGVFPPVELDGVMHVDGGAAGDQANTPVAPVFEYDEIWVVRLRSGSYKLPRNCKARLVLIRPDFNRSFMWGTFYFDADQVKEDIAAGTKAAIAAIDAYDAGRMAAGS